MKKNNISLRSTFCLIFLTISHMAFAQDKINNYNYKSHHKNTKIENTPLYVIEKIGFFTSSIFNLKKMIEANLPQNQQLSQISVKNHLGIGLIRGIGVGYAFHEYIGIGLGVFMHFNQSGGVQITNNAAGSSKFTTKIKFFKISLVPTLYFYPLGYNNSENICSIFVGPSLYYCFHVMAEDQQDNNSPEIALKIPNEMLNAMGIGVAFGSSYEFSFGLFIENQCEFCFTSLYNKNKKIIKKKKLDKVSLTPFSVNVSIGINWVKLLE